MAVDRASQGHGLNMRVDKNVGIEMRDGLVLRANLFRPEEDGFFPVIMSMGIYGKDVHFKDAYKIPWQVLKKLYPDVDANGSSGAYLRWEFPDPERWVPDGYVVVAIDARGSGQSPGYLDPFSATGTYDYYDAIEWAGRQPWSNGKVGLLGISYLAITQWQVAGLRPPHLAAICPWEGGSDLYRDWSHHGGIFSNQFPTEWMPRQVIPNQHGNAQSHHRDAITGERTTGPDAYDECVLTGSRADHAADLLTHPLDDAWYRDRSPTLERIEVPLLSAGNWGGGGLHLRGNIEGYLRAGAEDKRLFIHIGTHFESFYLPRYVAVQKRFFDQYLKGIDTGWKKEPPVELEIRRPDGASARAEREWPLARTEWQRYFLHPQQASMTLREPASDSEMSYAALGDGLNFSTAPFDQEVEFTGPVAARLFVSSSTDDMDIFVTLRLIDPAGVEVVFVGASEPVPVTRGWLRVSHRKLDVQKSTFYRPFLKHDERQMVEPGHIYGVDLEIWPTSVVVPPGYRLVLSLRGSDFEFPGLPGRMLHNSPIDRPADRFGGRCTLFTGPQCPSCLLLPMIPADAAS
jgi:predicted acyl esterase